MEKYTRYQKDEQHDSNGNPILGVWNNSVTDKILPIYFPTMSDFTAQKGSLLLHAEKKVEFVHPSVYIHYTFRTV